MEIWLSSEDTGAYGLDINTSLSSLVAGLVEMLPHASTMLRIGMTNPPFILNQLENIAAALNHPKVFNFLHIPVQSGSNHVLEGMNREYTIEEFEKVADYLLEHCPGVTIATDLICGFPNETENDFEETMKLMEKYKFHITNISQFYPRPGTPAAKMKRINTKIVKDRSRRLSTFFNSFTPYAGMEGRVEGCWVGVESDKGDRHIVGHMKNYTKVLLEFDKTLTGCYCEVKVVKVDRFHVVGVVVEGSVKRLVPELVEGGGEVMSNALFGEENCVGGCGDGSEMEGEEKKLEEGEGGGCGGGGCGSNNCCQIEEKKSVLVKEHEEKQENIDIDDKISNIIEEEEGASTSKNTNNALLAVGTALGVLFVLRAFWMKRFKI